MAAAVAGGLLTTSADFGTERTAPGGGADTDTALARMSLLRLVLLWAAPAADTVDSGAAPAIEPRNRLLPADGTAALTSEQDGGGAMGVVVAPSATV